MLVLVLGQRLHDLQRLHSADADVLIDEQIDFGAVGARFDGERF